MKDKKVNLISSIIFFFLGLVIFIDPGVVVKFISYFLGGCLIAIGLYKTINYLIKNKNLGVVNVNEISFGVVAMILGLLLVCLAGTLEFLLRFAIGAWMILIGIDKIMSSFYTTDRSKYFYSLLIVGVLFIGVGLYTIFVSNVPFAIIGLFMMIYGIIDFVSYFLYKKELGVTEETKEKLPNVIEGEAEEKDE